MKVLPQDARQQLEYFLSALFLPEEWIELRFIESWVSRGKKCSRVVRASEWVRPKEFVARHSEITEFAEREHANVYFGVCPRPRPGDSKDGQIRTVRCLWCDIDNVTAKEAFDRWQKANLPYPAIVVSSGRGIHGYWLLDRDVTTANGRDLIAGLLPFLYWTFDGDHVQNFSRVMRAPGTVNCKNVRNGEQPQPCVLLRWWPTERVSPEAFAQWVPMASTAQLERRIGKYTLPMIRLSTRARVDAPEVAELLTSLDRPVKDRSRRDFAVICGLLRLGLQAHQIWPLVAGSSKFKSNGQSYFAVTFANAERTVLLDSASANRPEVAI